MGSTSGSLANLVLNLARTWFRDFSNTSERYLSLKGETPCASLFAFLFNCAILLGETADLCTITRHILRKRAIPACQC